MKIIRPINAILTGSALLGLFLFSCQKESIKAPDPALPDQGPAPGFAPGFPKSAGFLSCFSKQFPDQIANKGQVNATALFNDPESYLYWRMDLYGPKPELSEEGNLSMGKVTLNDYPLPWYKGSYSGTPLTLMSFDTSLIWKIPGVQGVQGFTDTFQSPFPRLDALKSTSLAIRHSQRYTLEVAGYFNNYDSVFLSIPYKGFTRMKPGTNYLQFPEADIPDHPYREDSILLAVELRAFKYYYSRHSGRSYQYLFVTNVPVTLLFLTND